MRTIRSLPVLLLLASTAFAPAMGQSPAGIAIHMTEADFSQGCTLVDHASLTCEQIDAVGDGATNQFAWIVVYGWRTLPGWGGDDVGFNGAAFGVSYPPQTTVLDWVGCVGLEIPFADELIGAWPETDTGLALVLGSPSGVNPASGFFALGFLHLDAGSSGRLAVVRHGAPLIGAVQFVNANDLTFEVPRAGLSSADVGGDMPSNGQRTCEGTIPVRDVSWGRIKAAF